MVSTTFALFRQTLHRMPCRSLATPKQVNCIESLFLLDRNGLKVRSPDWGCKINLCENMMTSSNRNIIRVTGPSCGEFTSQQWIPLTKASEVELWSASEQTVEYTIETPVILDPIAPIVTSLWWKIVHGSHTLKLSWESYFNEFILIWFQRTTQATWQRLLCGDRVGY